MRFSIFTLFPEYFQSPFESSLLGKGLKAGILSVDFLALREFGEGKYRAVDDKPYGGGAGMVMMPTVLERAFEKLLGTQENVSALESSVERHRQEVESRRKDRYAPPSADGSSTLPLVIALSPQGKKLTADVCKRLAQVPHLALICGHYEGIDERAIQAFAHEEVSIGDFVLTGGEPAAVVLIDAISRFVPGIVGEKASVENDTFESNEEMLSGGLKSPVYTRPAGWRGKDVPAVLLSGNHGEISKWRKAQSQARTQSRRPDLAALQKK